jgi:predicted phosphate transport protein (TIGR00153 family)
MVRFSLVPENRFFFDYLERAGDNVAATATTVNGLLVDYSDVSRKLEEIRHLEHAGDEITHEIMKALNSTFLTPLDREDIAELARALDEIVDTLWGACVRLGLYRIGTVTATARQFGELLVEQTGGIASALPRLRNPRQMSRLIPKIEKINQIENAADELLHLSLSDCFSEVKTVEDLTNAVKWREIYAFLEEGTDAGEDVGDILESILLKYA